MIQVLFFAGLREHLGVESVELELPAAVTSVDALRLLLMQRGVDWQQALAGPRPLLCAINEEMAMLESTVQDGDIVAFFPPVTGG